MQEVEQAVLLNRWVTISEFADTVDVSFGSVCLHHVNSGDAPRCCKVCAQLSHSRSEGRRVEVGEDLLQRTKEDPHSPHLTFPFSEAENEIEGSPFQHRRGNLVRIADGADC